MYPAYFYYFSIATNAILRFLWLLNLSEPAHFFSATLHGS